MNEEIKVVSKFLVLDDDQSCHQQIKTFCDDNSLVPLKVHWKDGRAKCDIALAKGKAEHDKRDTIKDREGKREVERAMKSRSR